MGSCCNCDCNCNWWEGNDAGFGELPTVPQEGIHTPQREREREVCVFKGKDESRGRRCDGCHI